MLFSLEFYYMFIVKDVDCCLYILCMVVDWVCVSEKNNFVIINNIGIIIYK